MRSEYCDQNIAPEKSFCVSLVVIIFLRKGEIQLIKKAIDKYLNIVDVCEIPLF